MGLELGALDSRKVATRNAEVIIELDLRLRVSANFFNRQRPRGAEKGDAGASGCKLRTLGLSRRARIKGASPSASPGAS